VASFQLHRSGSARPVSPRIDAHAVGAALNCDGRFVLTLSRHDGTPAGLPVARVFETLSGNPIGPPIVLTNTPFESSPLSAADLDSFSLSPDGTRLLAICRKFVQTWDTVGAQPLFRRQMENTELAIWSPSMDVVASSSNAVVTLWNGSTGTELFPPLPHPCEVVYLEFSPSGRYFLTCGNDQNFTKCPVQVWQTRTGHPVGLPLEHESGVRGAHFSTDESRVVTAGSDFSATVWQTETGARKIPSVRHSGRVNAVSFCPEGYWFASASVDKTARIWSSETGDALTPPLVQRENVTNARFLADPCFLLTTDNSAQSWLWRIPVDKRPLADLRMIARLLSGDTVTPWSVNSSQDTNTLQTLWRDLRSRYPEDFTVSSRDIAAWHELQAADSMQNELWSAAVFHLQILMKLRPNDQSLANSLATAQKKLLPPDPAPDCTTD
jgi:WD40 domain-containing protein